MGRAQNSRISGHTYRARFAVVNSFQRLRSNYHRLIRLHSFGDICIGNSVIRGEVCERPPCPRSRLRDEAEKLGEVCPPALLCTWRVLDLFFKLWGALDGWLAWNIHESDVDGGSHDPRMILVCETTVLAWYATCKQRRNTAKTPVTLTAPLARLITDISLLCVGARSAVLIGPPRFSSTSSCNRNCCRFYDRDPGKVGCAR